MRKRFVPCVFLALIACISMIGGLFCYPALPCTAEDFAALTAQHVESQASSPVTQKSNAPQTLSAAQALQAFGTDVNFTSDADTVVYLSGSVTTGGQSYYYGAYVFRSHANPSPQVLHTESRSEFTDSSWTNIILYEVTMPTNEGVQFIGKGLFEQAQPVSYLVRDGWSLKTIHTTWYTRYPYAYQMTCRI